MVTTLPVSQVGTPSSIVQPGLQECRSRGLNGCSSRRRGCHLHRTGQTIQVGGPRGRVPRNSDGTGLLESGPLPVDGPAREELRVRHRPHHHGSRRHGHHVDRNLPRGVSSCNPASAEIVGGGTGEVTHGGHPGLQHRRHHRSHTPNELSGRAHHQHRSVSSDALNGNRGHHHRRSHSQEANVFRSHDHASRRHRIRSFTVRPEAELSAIQLGSLSLDSR